MIELRLYEGEFKGEYRVVEPSHLSNRSTYRVFLESGERQFRGLEIMTMIKLGLVSGIVNIVPVSNYGGKKK